MTSGSNRKQYSGDCRSRVVGRRSVRATGSTKQFHGRTFMFPPPLHSAPVQGLYRDAAAAAPDQIISNVGRHVSDVLLYSEAATTTSLTCRQSSSQEETACLILDP